jgi:hypothetical protein
MCLRYLCDFDVPVLAPFFILLYFGIFKLLCVNLYIDGEECTGEDSGSDVLENYCGINDRLALFINGNSMLKHAISIY